MLTNIGRQLFAGNAGNTVIPSMHLELGHIPCRTITSSDIKYFGDYVRDHSLTRRVTSISNTDTYGIALGSGNTPATEDDYTMESLITTGSVVIQTAATAYDTINKVSYGYINMTITNNTSDDITINELGLFVTARAANTAGGELNANFNYTVMVDHTILDAPLVIAPNDVGIIQYHFEVDD